MEGRTKKQQMSALGIHILPSTFCLPCLFAELSMSTWTPSMRPWNSATTHPCAESRSSSVASPISAAFVAAASYEARAFGVALGDVDGAVP